MGGYHAHQHQQGTSEFQYQKRQCMNALAITPEFVEGIRIGNWYQLTMRMMEVDAEKITMITLHPLARGFALKYSLGIFSKNDK